MYDSTREVFIDTKELNIGALIDALSLYDKNTKICICGEEYCYVLVEEDDSVVNIDVVDSGNLNQ